MDRIVLTTVLPRLRWQTERLGNAGKIGVGLLVFSVVFFFAAVQPRQVESNVLMDQVETTRLHFRSESTGVPGKKVRSDQGLGDFYAFFPNIDSSPFWIKELMEAALVAGVEINGSEYRMVREKGWKLARYEMMLPVRGGYPQLRAFMANALRVVPAMALVDIVIERKGVESELLEANLKFNLYLNEGKR